MQFWSNLIIFVVVCVALALSIYAFIRVYKKEKFNDDIKTFPDKKSCIEYASNNDKAMAYCSWGKKICKSDSDCPIAFSKNISCVCPGQNSKSCSKKVCKISNELPYCIPTTQGKYELECN